MEGASLDLGMLEDCCGPTKEELMEEFALTEEGHEIQVRSLQLLGFSTMKPEGQEPMGSQMLESFLSLL